MQWKNLSFWNSFSIQNYQVLYSDILQKPKYHYWLKSDQQNGPFHFWKVLYRFGLYIFFKTAFNFKRYEFLSIFWSIDSKYTLNWLEIILFLLRILLGTIYQNKLWHLNNNLGLKQSILSPIFVNWSIYQPTHSKKNSFAWLILQPGPFGITLL